MAAMVVVVNAAVVDALVASLLTVAARLPLHLGVVAGIVTAAAATGVGVVLPAPPAPSLPGRRGHQLTPNHSPKRIPENALASVVGDSRPVPTSLNDSS